MGVGRAIALFVSLALPLVTAGAAEADGMLDSFIADVRPGDLFPGADRIDKPQGDPPVAAAFAGDKKLGYLILNSDFVDSTGYSGKPIRILIALDMNAVIVAAKIVEHHEPIVLAGIPESKIKAAMTNYVGVNIAALETGKAERKQADIVSGATVTVMVIDDTVMHAASMAAQALELGGLKAVKQGEGTAEPIVDMDRSDVQPWQMLLDEGAVQRLEVTVDGVNKAFAKTDDPVAAARPERGKPDDTFVELYAAMVSVPTIGRSLLGEAEYDNLRKKLAKDQQAILLAGKGRYSFKGSGYVRGGIFDRFQIKQGDNAVRFHDHDYKRIRRIEAAGAPDLKENDIFIVPEDAEFHASRPWRIELLVGRATGATKKAFVTFDLPYQLPQKFLKVQAATIKATMKAPAGIVRKEGSPLWMTLWKQKIWQVVVLSVALVVLTAVFFFQGWLVRRPRLTEWVRTGFLIFTLVGIGWYANAQLSVVNILTVFNSLSTGFNWNYFLMEPLIFILWGAVAASLLFWGRGAFCGWLCPFGAMQELLSKIAKALHVPQIAVPWWLHERLWALKYVLFLVLFGVSLHSLNWAERLAEVEPFKTAIVLKFAREWPYVLFAASMLAAGLFIERFYCRYVCPLGAALAIPGKIRLFEWLKRYKECGAPCQRCARECMVQAIHPEGNINPNECLYCLHCQVVYVDDQRCYVLVQRRLKHERRTVGASRPRSLTEAVSDIENVTS